MKKNLEGRRKETAQSARKKKETIIPQVMGSKRGGWPRKEKRANLGQRGGGQLVLLIRGGKVGVVVGEEEKKKTLPFRTKKISAQKGGNSKQKGGKRYIPRSRESIRKREKKGFWAKKGVCKKRGQKNGTS